METASVTSKGQLVIPARLRRKYRIEPGTKVLFVERENEILIQPVTKEYVRSVCGLFKRGTSATQALLQERAKDKEREEAKFAKRGSR
jgi:AbrB family looped-hinge helix DNA binding protein